MTTDQHAARTIFDPRVAFAELERSSAEDVSMESTLHHLAEVAKRRIPSVAEASVTLIADDGPSTAAYTGRLARDLDEAQYGRGRGPCLEAALGAETVEIADARVETRWPDYTPVAVGRGALSSLSVPLPIRERLHGALNLYATRAGAFDAGTRAAATTFGSHAAVAVHDMHPFESTRELADSLDQAMRTRAAIEQAKGIVMCQRGCDATRAFHLLAAASQRSGRKLGHVARSIVDGVSGHDGQSC